MKIFRLINIYLQHCDNLFILFFGRLFITAVILSILSVLIMLARKGRVAAVRSWLWTLCVPALFIPFDRGLISLMLAFGITSPLSTYPASAIAGFPLWRYLWLGGFIVSSIKTHMDYKKTIGLLEAGKLSGCASYFYKGKSRIYLPPDFKKDYTPLERELLLAHENQHIRQHDPLLLRILLFIKCFFWFNPLVHKAFHLIRQDRELLCDEKVTSRYPKYEYGRLLLSEAKRTIPSPAIAGIVSEPGGIYERVSACVEPLSANKRPAIIVALIIVPALFVSAFMALTTSLIEPTRTLTVFTCDGASYFEHIPGTEKYVSLDGWSVQIDEKGLYEYALSLGFNPETMIFIKLGEAVKQTLCGEFTFAVADSFTVAELLSENSDTSFDHYDVCFDLWTALFKFL